MSDKYSNCDRSDSSQCTKKGDTLVIETGKISYADAVAVDAPAAEHDGKCKSGSSAALACTAHVVIKHSNITVIYH